MEKLSELPHGNSDNFSIFLFEWNLVVHMIEHTSRWHDYGSTMHQTASFVIRAFGNRTSFICKTTEGKTVSSEFPETNWPHLHVATIPAQRELCDTNWLEDLVKFLVLCQNGNNVRVALFVKPIGLRRANDNVKPSSFALHHSLHKRPCRSGH